MKKTTNDYLTEFNKFILTVKQEYKYYSDEQIKQEKIENDYLHQIELGEYKDRQKATTQLKKCLIQRRIAKDNLAILTPIYNWIMEFSDAIRKFPHVVGQVRLYEDKLKDRKYYPKAVEDLPIYKNNKE